MTVSGETDSWIPYAGFGGAVVCCLGLELLGGVAILSSLAAAVGLSTGLAYAAVVAFGGVIAVLLALGYRQIGGAAHT